MSVGSRPLIEMSSSPTTMSVPVAGEEAEIEEIRTPDTDTA